MMTVDKFGFKAYARQRSSELAQRVRELREQEGLTQKDVAGFLGCSSSRISRVEKGQGSYGLEELEILLARFGVAVESVTRLRAHGQMQLIAALSQERTGQALLDRVALPVPQDFVGAMFVEPVFAPEGDLVAYAGCRKDGGGAVVAWDPHTGEKLWRHDHPTAIYGIAFSGDGRWLALSTENDTVVVLDRATRRVEAILDPVEAGLVDQEWWDYVNELEPGYGAIGGLAFSPDSQRLVWINEEVGTLRVYQVGSWKHERTILVSQLVGRKYYPHDEPEKYGSVSAWLFQFTVDGQAVVIGDFGNRLHYVPLHGQSIGGYLLADMPSGYDEVLLEPGDPDWSETKVLHVAGGTGQTFELWESSRTGQSDLWDERDSKDEGWIRGARIVDHKTILVVERIVRKMPVMVVKNMVSNLAVVIPEDGADYKPAFSSDGQMLAFCVPPENVLAPGSRCNVYVQHLDLDVLRNSRSLANVVLLYSIDANEAELVTRSLPVGGIARRRTAESASVEGASSSFIDWDRRLQEGILLERRRLVSRGLVFGRTVADRLRSLKETGLSSNANRDGVFVLDDVDMLPLPLTVWAADIEQKAGLGVEIVDLGRAPAGGAQMSVRDVVQAAVGRPLLDGETTIEVVGELANRCKGCLLILDGIERLSADALVWLVSEARSLAELVFVVPRDMGAFGARIREYSSPGWLTGRMEVISCLALSGSSGDRGD